MFSVLAGLKCEDASLEELEKKVKVFDFRDARSLTTWSDYHRSRDRMLRNLHVGVIECQGRKRLPCRGEFSCAIGCLAIVGRH